MGRLSGRPLVIGGGILLAAVLLIPAALNNRPRATAPAAPVPEPSARPPTRLEAVAALGRLEPAGDVRHLAAPITGIGGSPRITRLLVEEGDRVRAGQLLASFDNAPPQRAQEQVLAVRITNLEQRVRILSRDLERDRRLARAGATSTRELEERQIDLLELEGRLSEARAELVKTRTDLVNTELRAPIDGVVLRLHAREGERPGDNGILELGSSDRMEALLEVYESDIGRVRLGQSVRLSSENGGFSGELQGEVVRISPQVRQRQVLATDPTGDADARVVEVRVQLRPADASRVRALAGLKLVARLAP